jgi:tetratricopeptide (TPR) repeat protein
MIAEPEQKTSLPENSGQTNTSDVHDDATAPTKSIPSAWKWVLALLIAGLISYPVYHRLSGSSAETNPAEAELNRSQELYKAGQYDGAIAAAQAALKAKPDYALAYNNLAVSYLQLKKYDEAIQNAQQALRLQPDLELAKNNLAMIQQEKAKASAPPPVPPAPGTAGYFMQQSLENFQAGKFQDAINSAQQALKIDPKMATAYNNISVSYTRLGVWDKAIDNALKALQIQPDFELARNNLNWALTSKAEALAQKK